MKKTKNLKAIMQEEKDVKQRLVEAHAAMRKDLGELTLKAYEKDGFNDDFEKDVEAILEEYGYPIKKIKASEGGDNV
ncbi:MAG: hypothetical protein M1276_01060 [Deltaproteobacteria bacterium]|jgi:hypothetical protein|nr:hypothetical protein [Deltaproteobacteria bacterium]